MALTILIYGDERVTLTCSSEQLLLVAAEVIRSFFLFKIRSTTLFFGVGENEGYLQLSASAGLPRPRPSRSYVIKNLKSKVNITV